MKENEVFDLDLEISETNFDVNGPLSHQDTSLSTCDTNYPCPC
jgi:hypothetical protein